MYKSRYDSRHNINNNDVGEWVKLKLNNTNAALK